MKEEQKENQKKNDKLSGSRKTETEFEKALKKCPKLTVSDEKVVEFRRKGRK